MHPQVFSKTVTINAAPATVWHALTDIPTMKRWMSELELDIATDWTPGGPFVIRGTLYKKPFENRGVVLAYEPERRLGYSHLSSLSRLPDEPESYTHLYFTLSACDGCTELTVTITNFPTAAIYHHIAFYWNVTTVLLKRSIDGDS